MSWWGLILAGIAGGIMGGMGLGGGTLLIPILTMMLGVGQIEAQLFNLVSFIPMAALSLIVHIKNKMVDYKSIWYVLPTALIFTIAGALLSGMVKPEIIKVVYGVFLIVLSSVFLLKSIFSMFIQGLIGRKNHSFLAKKSTLWIKSKKNINLM